MTEMFVMKEQDDSCTFRSYKKLLKKARDKSVNEDIPLKMMLNAGLAMMLDKKKGEMEGILTEAEKGGEI